MSVAGIILCGGASRRMGRDKAWLELEGRTLLERATINQSACAKLTIVCAAHGQALPVLASGVIRLDDEQPDQGPLPALANGLLRAEHEGCEIAFVQAVDLPLLSVSVIQFLISQLGPDTDAAVPFTDNHRHGLCSAYRTTAGHVAAELVSKGQRSVQALLNELRVQSVSEDSMKRVDPGGLSLRNINTPTDYETLTRNRGNKSG